MLNALTNVTRMKMSSNQVFDGTNSVLSSDARRQLGFKKSRSLCDWLILIVTSGSADVYVSMPWMSVLMVRLPNNIMIRVLYREEKEAEADQ